MTPCFRFPRITAREYFFGFYKANIKAVRNSHGHKDRKPALMPFWQTTSKRMPLIRLVYHHIIHLPLLPPILKGALLKPHGISIKNPSIIFRMSASKALSFFIAFTIAGLHW